MGKKILFWGGVLIGGYVLATHATGSARVVNSAGSNSVHLIKALQGR
jgi:hypothetical protein